MAQVFFDYQSALDAASNAANSAVANVQGTASKMSPEELDKLIFNSLVSAVTLSVTGMILDKVLHGPSR